MGMPESQRRLIERSRWQPLTEVDERIGHSEGKDKNMAQPTDAELAYKLMKLGYKVDFITKQITPPTPPQTRAPQRQTQALVSETYDDDAQANMAATLRAKGYQVHTPWLPSSLAGKDAGTWKKMADRRVPWAQVAKEDSPDDVMQAMCSMLAYDIMSRDASARGRRLDSLMDMDTQI